MRQANDIATGVYGSGQATPAAMPREAMTPCAR